MYRKDPIKLTNTATSNVSTRSFVDLTPCGVFFILDSYMGVAINRVYVKLTTRSKNKPGWNEKNLRCNLLVCLLVWFTVG